MIVRYLHKKTPRFKNGAFLSLFTFFYKRIDDRCENHAVGYCAYKVINKEVEGLFDENNLVMTCQFEPVVPIDELSENTFQRFLELMNKHGGKKNA